MGKKIKKRILLLGGLLLLGAAHASPQSAPFRYTVEAGCTLGGGDHTPFWLANNRHGVSSVRRNTAGLTAGVFQTEKGLGKHFSYAYGAELEGAVRTESGFFIQQAYAELHYRCFALVAGSKVRGSELKNDALSTGGLILSPNARPVPQVRVEIPGFVPIPGLRGWLHVKGHVAFGRFTDDSYQKDFTGKKSKYTEHALYHSKALFLKLENGKIPFDVTAGIEAAAQFAGTCYYPDGTTYTSPHSFRDFLRVLVCKSGGSQSSESDQKNKYGNHLGSYHLSVRYKFPTWSVRGYYEHPFDDGSGMRFSYGMWKDCLAGVEVTPPANRVVKSVVMEYLCTKDQSGAFHFFSKDWGTTYTGNDNYYNNGQYAGWEHWGMALGNPLLTSPAYNADRTLSFQNNRVKGFHIGINGEPLQGLRYRLLLTCTRNWGTYTTPYDDIRSLRSGFVEVAYSPSRTKGWTFTLSAGADGGNLLGRNAGGMVTLNKTGKF